MARALIAGLLLCAALAAPASAAPAAPLQRDVNGDGIADVVTLGAPYDIAGMSRSYHGAAVVLGAPGAAPVDAAAPGARGFRIETTEDLSGAALAGDVNGDGLGDVVVLAAPRSSAAGAAYVVYGSRTPATVDLANLGTRGARIADAYGYGRVAAPGDVDGDGRADVAVEGQGGSVSVVTAARSYRIVLRAKGLGSVNVLASAGDANGDGRGDLLVGYENDVYCGEAGDGCGTRSLVVFGKADRRTVVIRGSQRTGYKPGWFTGRPRTSLGYDVNATFGYDGAGTAGDFDGDRRDDVIASGWNGAPAGIVFGKRTGTRVVIRSDRASGGLALRHSAFFGVAAGGLGDVNGDGLGDVLATDNGRAPTAVVVFGRRGRSAIDLTSPKLGGLRLVLAKGVEPEAAAPAGDVNGDGRADLLFVTAGQTATPYVKDIRTFVIYGPAAAGTLSLDALGAGGFEIRHAG